MYGIFKREYVNGKCYEQMLHWSPVLQNDRYEAQKQLDNYVAWVEKNSDVRHVKIKCDDFLYKTIELPKTIDVQVLDELTTTTHDEFYERCYVVKELAVIGEKSAPQIIEESFEHMIAFINREYEERKRSGEGDAVLQYSNNVNGSLFFIPPGKRWKVVKKE